MGKTLHECSYFSYIQKYDAHTAFYHLYDSHGVVNICYVQMFRRWDSRENGNHYAYQQKREKKKHTKNHIKLLAVYSQLANRKYIGIRNFSVQSLNILLFVRCSLVSIYFDGFSVRIQFELMKRNPSTIHWYLSLGEMKAKHLRWNSLPFMASFFFPLPSVHFPFDVLQSIFSVVCVAKLPSWQSIQFKFLPMERKKKTPQKLQSQM